MPLAASVLEGSHEFLLLRIYGDDRLPPAQTSLHLAIDVFELQIPVRMRTAFSYLSIRLEAEAEIPKQTRDENMACLVPLSFEFC